MASMEMAEFVVVMNSLRACYQNGLVDEERWALSLRAYWEALRERDAIAVRKAFFRARTAHPDWMPSLGQLAALVDLSEREAGPSYRERLTDGSRYVKPSQESIDEARALVQEVMARLDASTVGASKRKKWVPPWKGGPPFEVH